VRCRRLHLRDGAALLLAVALLFPAASGQAAVKSKPAAKYEIVELPIRPLSVSNSGWVAGADKNQHAATWNTKGELSHIPLPSKFNFSECSSINSRGDAACTAATEDSTSRMAFVVRNHEVAWLPGQQSRASSINEDGEIAGQAIAPGGKRSGPVLWKNNSAIDLNLCCAGGARAINGRHQIAGDSYDEAGKYHAFVWDEMNGARRLNVAGAEYSSALALNDDGVVLVKATPGGLFFFSGDRSRPVDIPKGSPRAMNNDRTVVGSFGPDPAHQRAFVWNEDGGIEDFNTLIPPNSGWTLEVASGVNDRGEIVGWGDHGGIDNAGFLLRPLPDGHKPGAAIRSRPTAHAIPHSH